MWIAILAFLACDDEYDRSDRDDFTPGVMECEEAYARLERCCPGFRIWKKNEENELGAFCIDFEYDKKNSYSCDGNDDHIYGHLRPSLTRDEAGCIRGATCDDLVTRGTCERARELEPLGESSGKTRTRPPVCP